MDCLPSYEKWNDPSNGNRALLKEALEGFRFSFDNILDEKLDRSSHAYHVASSACTLSITWIEELMTFMDDLHRELTRYRFSSNHAWHLVTRQVHRIFMELSAPRLAVNTQYDSKETEANGNMILWAVCRSHDVMARYKRFSFKNDPSVAAEYVKFLITHSGNDNIDKLTKSVKDLTDELAKVSRTANTATTALNRVDDNKKALDAHKKTVEALERRLAKLEK